MKRCPECRRNYHDDTLSYCLADGSELVYGLEEDEPATALLRAPEGRRSGGTFNAEIAELSERTPAVSALHQSGGVEVKDTSAAFDKRLLVAPMMLVLIVLGGFLGYRYFAQAKQIESIADEAAKEGLIARLQQRADAGDFWLFQIRTDRTYDSLRGDPRFQEILKRFDPPQ